MNINGFFKIWNNKPCDFDHAFGNQCVDIVKQYFQDVLSIVPVHGNAIDYWNKPPIGFQKIKNSPINCPQEGDLIVLNILPYGHISICNSANIFTYNCFEQNNPLGSFCHFATHGYRSVLGWLRPNPSIAPPNLPKIPLKIACLSPNSAIGSDFQAQVALYSSNKITTLITQYSASFTGKIAQDQAYALVDQINPSEKFVFLFYQGTPDSVFYSTYYYPKRDCIITTCPANDPRLLAFEFSHAVQITYDNHRGQNPYVEVVDSNFPSDDLIKQKFDSVSGYYQ